MTAYYNEFDPAAAHVLRHMIDIGLIAPGVVDTRSIKEVTPDDVKGFTQVHLFAGGGFWSYAARLAGWPDHEQLWTASCPCQPFSSSGKREGTDDPRHLWPDVYRLARALRPAVIMGEQVAAKAGYGWFDGVRTDMAREGYASRSVDFPACGVDAPHQRNRQYWVSVGDAYNTPGRIPNRKIGGAVFNAGRTNGSIESPAGNEGLHANADSGERDGRSDESQRGTQGRIAAVGDYAGRSYWHDAEWIVCHDDKARRAKPGLRFLVDGLPGRLDYRSRGGDENLQEASQAPYYGFLVKDMIGRIDLWRIAGNAIVPEAAREVIGAFIDTYGLPSSWGNSR